jgi:hypothetical protein
MRVTSHDLFKVTRNDQHTTSAQGEMNHFACKHFNLNKMRGAGLLWEEMLFILLLEYPDMCTEALSFVEDNVHCAAPN